MENDRDMFLHHFTYNKEEGELYWRVPTSVRVKVGDRVGSIDNAGYIHFYLHNRAYKLHRVIWLIETGEWPVGEIDHIDRDPAHNTFTNLRDASRSVNGANVGVHIDNELGVKGVTYDKNYAAKPYCVRISRDGKTVYRSWHATLKEAEQRAKELLQ